MMDVEEQIRLLKEEIDRIGRRAPVMQFNVDHMKASFVVPTGRSEFAVWDGQRNFLGIFHENILMHILRNLPNPVGQPAKPQDFSHLLEDF